MYFLITDEKLLGDVITHSVSFLFLALLNCSNSVLVRGVYIDAEEPAGQCVIFPVYYIRLFFQKERTKKQKKILNALENIDHQNNNTTSLLIEKPTTNNQIITVGAGTLTTSSLILTTPPTTTTSAASPITNAKQKTPMKNNNNVVHHTQTSRTTSIDLTSIILNNTTNDKDEHTILFTKD